MEKPARARALPRRKLLVDYSGIERNCGTLQRGGDLAARGEAVVVVEAGAAAGSGARVHEPAAAAPLPLRRVLSGRGGRLPGAGEGERPLVVVPCKVDDRDRDSFSSVPALYPTATRNEAEKSGPHASGHAENLWGRRVCGHSARIDMGR